MGDENDLMVPTFVLVLLTFVWVTGTPTVETVRVEEPTTFEVGSDSTYLFGADDWQFREYARENLTCTSEVVLMSSLSRGKVTPIVEDGEQGACAAIQTVEKTVVELYGFEVVL